MHTKRVPLYERLPEIYRIRDEEQEPPYPLKSYLSLVEGAFAEIHRNIEQLYHDLFIETCDDWVVPYIGDLLGVSHLQGKPNTLRADVAEAIALRRRKGTLAGMEKLAFTITGWGVHCLELRENLAWNQHLNHQRPDRGGEPAYGKINPFLTRHTPIRGGTATLRDPGVLGLLDTPFDPFARLADFKPARSGDIRWNLPNLAVFLWRLRDYRVPAAVPLFQFKKNVSAGCWAVAFRIHPCGDPLTLFNAFIYDPDLEPPVVTEIDATPNPIPISRLTEGAEAGRPEKYLSVETYDPDGSGTESIDLADTGLQLHLPVPEFSGKIWPASPSFWRIRGANLCAWEEGVRPEVQKGDIVIDPGRGRLLMMVKTEAQADALRDHLRVTHTYGFAGPAGAHPVTRQAAPQEIHEDPVKTIEVEFQDGQTELPEALNQLKLPAYQNYPLRICIMDSGTYLLDLASLTSEIIDTQAGETSLLLKKSLIIQSADNQRPVIRLARPLRFRPLKVAGADAAEQEALDALMENLSVRLEGLYITRADAWEAAFVHPCEEPLLARAAVNRLEIYGCTLDPGGFIHLDSDRAPIYRSVEMDDDFEFSLAVEKNAFRQIPQISISRSILGPVLLDQGYTLELTDTILDAGGGPFESPAVALSGPGADPASTWGPETQFQGITVFGRTRLEKTCGAGGIFAQDLEVRDNQNGCIRFSYFKGETDRLPQNYGCVRGTEAHLQFVSEYFGRPGYAQLALTTDFDIRERGPGDDAMGAFGFLYEAHAWRNLQVRFREFMPVGVRPLFIPVT